MKINFIVCEIDKDSILWEIFKKFNGLNEFIIIEEEKNLFKVLQLNKDGLKLIPGLKLNEIAYTVEKDKIKAKKDNLPGQLYVELDIPKQFLTVDIINNIREIND